MKAQNVFIHLSLVASSVLAFSSVAKADSFVTNFNAVNGNAGDINLLSIQQNGKTITDFSLVNNASIIYNTPVSSILNSGAASTDLGITANNPNNPNPVYRKEDPTDSDIAAYLGKENLNNIIDTEDAGSFNINVFFDSQITTDNLGVDNLFFWERGQNSDLGVQAIDADGNTIGNFFKLSQTRSSSNFAGYSIHTVEGNFPQSVGSWGLDILQDLGVSSLAGLKLTADSSYNWRDFKVIARQSVIDMKSVTVPESSNLIGLSVLGAIAFIGGRQRVLKRVQ